MRAIVRWAWTWPARTCTPRKWRTSCSSIRTCETPAWCRRLTASRARYRSRSSWPAKRAGRPKTTCAASSWSAARPTRTPAESCSWTRCRSAAPARSIAPDSRRARRRLPCERARSLEDGLQPLAVHALPRPRDHHRREGPGGDPAAVPGGVRPRGRLRLAARRRGQRPGRHRGRLRGDERDRARRAHHRHAGGLPAAGATRRPDRGRQDGAGGQDHLCGRRRDPRLDGHAGRGGPRVLRCAATRQGGTMSTSMPPDNLNEIGVLKRREIEARVLMPVLEALGAKFGRAQIFETARNVIIDVARAQGKELAGRMGGDTLGHFATALEDWKKGDAYRMDVLAQSEEKFSFNVTRCRYAEMYRALGIPEIGALLSCNRDFSLVEGFNPAVKLTRTQTVMEGASHCDFRFELRRPGHHAEATTHRTSNAVGGSGGGAAPLPPR